MMGTIASTARTAETPLASWKKRGTWASGAVWAKAMTTPAKSATVTARTWMAASSRRAIAAPQQREGGQGPDARGEDDQPCLETEAAAHGDERDRAGQQPVGPEDVDQHGPSRRVDGSVHVGQRPAGDDAGR